MLSTSSILLALVASGPIFVTAHGVVSQIAFGDVLVDAWAPYTDPYRSPMPEKLTREYNSNGPIEDVTSAAFTCNTNGATENVPVQTIQTGVKAGDSMTFYWTVWPDSHKGPVMTYLADCQGDCSTFNATGDVWFKIDESGYSNGVWASDTLIQNNSSYTTKIPTTIASGQYLLRHEILALHSASSVNGAQWYPSCNQINVTSTGSLKPAGVAIPGYIKADDPGVLINIYTTLTNYTIPGPAVIEGGTSGGSVSNSSASTSVASGSSVVSSGVAAAATSSGTQASTGQQISSTGGATNSSAGSTPSGKSSCSTRSRRHHHGQRGIPSREQRL